MRNQFVRYLFCALFVPCGLASSLARPSTSATDSPSDASTMTNLARNDPLAFLENCVKHYDRDVRGYLTTMQKQERLQGRLQNKEVIEVAFRDQPHSVSLHWLQGARKADRVVFVAGENDGMMLAHPAGTAGKLVHDPELYRNMNDTVKDVRQLIADIRSDPHKYLRVKMSLF